MKTLSLLLAAVVLVISLPACATAPKKQECCGSASCPPSKTCPVTHGHHHKKAS